jgi:hypothetical protein
MIIVSKGKGCGNQPMVSGTIGKRENGKRKYHTSVEDILCALFCGESKKEILEKNKDMSEQDFEDALTFSMYAISKFNGKEDLQWDKDSEENKWSK